MALEVHSKATEPPEAALKGISLRGLAKLRVKIEELCAQGHFDHDETINGTAFKGTRDIKELRTTQLVYK